jgi:hypothetical protein
MSNLRVWWIPQMGMDGKPFIREVENVKEGWKLINILADYDLYQLENRIKPDYSNAGGLEYLDEDTRTRPTSRAPPSSATCRCTTATAT